MNPLIILHETLYPYTEVITYFQPPNTRYHVCIKKEGQIIYCANPTDVLFNCGRDTSYMGENINGSVDPIAYHVCLESPYSSKPNDREHEGYTNEQYKSLGWLVKSTGIDISRLIGHADLDTNQGVDPRSFSMSRFFTWYSSARSDKKIDIQRY